MEELNKYIETLKQKIEHLEKAIKEKLTEEEIIMFIYIDLGEQLYLNPDFMLGNTKTKEEIYINDNTISKLEEIFKKRKVTCKTASKILEYIIKKFGINITTNENDSKDTKYKHTYNIIFPSDGREPYRIDLQNDLKNIQFHTMTRKFGRALNENRYVISLQKQKEIHKKIKYLTQEKPYTEEYMYLLKLGASEFDNIYKKIDFVLKNIEPNPNPNIKFLERAWRHKKIFEYIFDGHEIDKILNGITCYKINENNEKEYINCFFIFKGNTYIYLYDENQFGYKKYALEKFAIKIKEEHIIIPSEIEIPGLNEIINQTNKKNHHK